MSIAAVLAPVFVLVGLTFFLMFWMGRSRIAVLRSGDIKMRDVALGERNWPPPTQQVVNAYNNQFEMPVLFYALVALALITRKADLVFVLMSWIYVATRLAHAYIYTTSNKMVRRFQAFVIGALILLLMWIIFALRILSAQAGI
jgi:hypothetical protein